MKRLVFLVEGSTEIMFVKNHVMPYLYNQGIINPMVVSMIITNRKLHVKGGNISYSYLKNDIERYFAQGNVILTTFLDFFRLPTDFPGYTTESKKVHQIEQALHHEFNNHECFLPYIQLHEIEALMFSNIAGFEFVIDQPKQLQLIQEIIDYYQNPEDINTNPETAPSKRMIKIFNYDKVADAAMILDCIGIDTMKSKCPRFSEWLSKLEFLLVKHS